VRVYQFRHTGLPFSIYSAGRGGKKKIVEAASTTGLASTFNDRQIEARPQFGAAPLPWTHSWTRH
jgi:hypothetical protein